MYIRRAIRMRLIKITFKEPKYLYDFLIEQTGGRRIIPYWEMTLPYDVVHVYKSNILVRVACKQEFNSESEGQFD